MKQKFCVLLIAAAVLAVHAPAVRNDFVWDDTALVLRDPLIRSWRLIPEAFNHFLFTDATASDFYRPIQRLSYTADYAAFGFRPAGYHIASIVFHAAAAVALFFFAEELLSFLGVAANRRRIAALIASGIWAVHPVHNAAVDYVSGRADPLAAMFGFAGLYCALRSFTAEKRTRWLVLTLSAVLLLFSALSKESGLLFGGLLLLCVSLQRRWKLLPHALGMVAFVFITYFSLRMPAEHYPAPRLHPPAPLLVRPVIAARAVAEYAGLIVFPWNLRMERDVETRPQDGDPASSTKAAWRELQTLLGLALLAGAVFWMWRARRDRAVFALLIVTGCNYLPVSGLFPLNASVAEHWLYLPSAFLFLAASISAITFVGRANAAPVPGRILVVLCALWVLFLGTRTFMRTFDWKNQRTFLERTIAAGGDSARMLINLGILDFNEGRLDQAKAELSKALAKEPDQPFALLNLAAVAIRQNDFASARDLLTRAKKWEVTEGQAYELLAVLENKEHGQSDPMRMRLASRSGPPNWSIEKRYLRLLDATGLTAAAITELQVCLRTQWYRAESWQLLSELLEKTGRANEAALAHRIANDYDVRLAEHNKVL